MACGSVIQFAAAFLSTSLLLLHSFSSVFSLVDPLPTGLKPIPKEVYVRNDMLHNIEKIGEGLLFGSEDIAVDSQGVLYTGNNDGWVKRVFPDDGRVENWTYVGGHPLGLVVGRYGEVLVIEATMGLLNVTHGSVEVLSGEAEGIPYKIADELDVARDNTVYFTDASMKFTKEEYRLDIFEARPNGRLLKYDPMTRTTTVLLKDLYFPNGVALSVAEDFLVFCETTKARCKKYWLQGPDKGTTDTFIDGLPAFPDNIHLSASGEFWIALVSDRLWYVEMVGESPFLKKLISPLYPYMYDESFGMAKVLAVNSEGIPLAFYEDPTGKVISFVTTALPVGNDIFLGNLGKNYIGKMKVVKEGIYKRLNSSIVQAAYEDPKALLL